MSSTTTSPFRPLPFLSNPHLQTVLGALIPGRTCPPPGRSHVVALPDGDAVVLHENVPPRWRPGGPVALLVHGLSGSHRSAHIRRMAAGLLARQVLTYRIDLRGHGAGVHLSRRTAHAGRSEDIRFALGRIHAGHPSSPLLLLGISLGGNAVLKMAGEAAERTVPGLARVAVIAPPIDLDVCSTLVSLPNNRVYERRWVRALLREATRRHSAFPDLPALRLPRRMTLRQFDDLYTAPHNGFDGVDDFYRQASALPVVPRIAIPTLILTARDDPFIAVEPIEALRAPAHVRVEITSGGGHVGYVGWDGAGGIRWAERRLVDWLVSGYNSAS